MPENRAYFIAAYVIIAVIFGAYALSLWVRARNLKRKP
jgi:hypothetical protein